MAGRLTVDAVWDDTVRVLGDRAGRLAPVALLAFVLPAAVQAAVRLFPVAAPARLAVLGLLISVGGLVLSLWGALAVVALAAEPAPAPAAARSLAGRRLPPSMGVAAVLALAVVLLSLPVGLAAAFSGMDMAAMSRGGVPGLPAGGGKLILAVSLAVLVLLLWLGARLLPTQAVVLHERRGLGAIRAAFASTRGLGLRLVGAELVFALVVVVAGLATQSALGTVLALLLGPDRIAVALFLAALAAALVSAALTAVAWVFVARLYAALAEAGRTGGGAVASEPVPSGPWGAGGAGAVRPAI